MLFPLRVIRRIHREGFRCIPEAIRFRIALHRQRPFLQTETALRQAEEDGYQAFIRRHEAPLSAHFTPTMRLSFLIPTYNTPPELLRAQLAEMYDPAVPFRQCEDADTCKFCDFRIICKRG